MQLSFQRYVATTLAPSLAGIDKPSSAVADVHGLPIHRLADVMDRWGLKQKYDVFVLTRGGGSNGNPEWRTSFVSHIRGIHHPIDHIVVVEHRDGSAHNYIEV